jgi:hypothetical protein
MSEFSGRDPLHVPPPLEGRLAVLPPSKFGSSAKELVVEALEHVFDTKSPLAMAAYTGDRPAAIEAVQTGLVNSLETATADGRTDLDNILFPASHYFTHPDRLIVAAMQRRTDMLKGLFMLDDLDEALARSNGGYLAGAFPVDDPDFSWVDMTVDNHTYLGFRYEFYKEEPRGSDEHPDAFYHAGLQYLNQRHAPDLVTDDYPYYAGLVVTEQSVGEAGYSEQRTFELPPGRERLLSTAARTLVIDGLAEQLGREVEIHERVKAALNHLARIVVRDTPDPVEARDQLEAFGIFDDPENFR